MSWALREAGTNDPARLAVVGSATFLETFAGLLEGDAIIEHCRSEHSEERYQRYLEGGADAWLAELDLGAAPVGFALLAQPHLPDARDDGSDLELKRIYILSRFHGTGIGTALMQHSVASARERGACRLVLRVYSGNERALTFYRKQGFVPVATRQFAVGSQSYHDIVMALALG